MTKGFFMTLEGPEGSGKTTVAKLLVERLEKEVEKSIVLTREPGGIAIAEKIRDVILDVSHTMMDARTEALLYAASRRQHLVEKVMPALTDGKVVVCDRFVDSSLAYQGYGRNIGVDNVWEMNQFAIADLMPQVTFYLDVPIEVGFERIYANKDREINRLDLEKKEFHETVVEGYRQVIERFPERIVVINANQAVEEVTEAIIQTLKQRFPEIFRTLKGGI
ncbi:dTMP kinase [Brochothrix thermosphacta]|uniref:dTMP kinase n=1 Tax=Brochothrix thermosphacta TaxID=2756 RepID=UPI00083FC1AB|nr:dTMP kinase [Brochothrix thermosphacta]ODJ60944.1 dTMP kinase [Brochothrix thermosphacta]ODJ65632.1 dTMP kinase [Brochothrix thermosphacta]SPN70632.1 thymidylate kinase [Brochothrix thermosphacta]